MKYTKILFVSGVGMMILGFVYSQMLAGVTTDYDTPLDFVEKLNAHTEMATVIAAIGFILFIVSVGSHILSGDKKKHRK